VQEYLTRLGAESARVASSLTAFEAPLGELQELIGPFVHVSKLPAIIDALDELSETTAAYEADRIATVAAIALFWTDHRDTIVTANLATQRAAREAFDPIVESLRGLVKQVDLLYKLAARVPGLIADADADASRTPSYDRRGVATVVKRLDERRKDAVGQLKTATYFYRQAAWLQDRFPDAELRNVPGLVAVVDQESVRAADWSLTPARYVGVAPEEEDEDFDFEQSLRDIATEIADLNDEAARLAASVQQTLQDMVG
jgi:type I restriction enzyme M protein